MNVTTPKAQRAEILIHKNEYYALEDNTVIDHTDKPAKLFNDVIDYIEKGQISVSSGVYELEEPIEINTSGIEINCYGNCGDLYFSNDDTYYGYSNKMPVSFVAENFDAFQIGKEDFNQGISLKNMLITGIKEEGTMKDEIFSKGSGIKVIRSNTLNLENIQVMRKKEGLQFETNETFAYDNVIDKVHLSNIMLSHNQKGILQRGWMANVRAKNIWGYINALGLFDIEPKYDWVVEDAFSNADGWQSVSPDDSIFNIVTNTNFQLIRPKVFGSYGTEICKVPLLRFILNKKEDSFGEWYRPHVVVDIPELAGTESDAIRVEGNAGLLEIRNPSIGLSSPNASQDWLGGSGIVGGSVVFNRNEEIKVKVRDGFAHCLQHPNYWFINCETNNVYTI